MLELRHGERDGVPETIFTLVFDTLVFVHMSLIWSSTTVYAPNNI